MLKQTTLKSMLLPLLFCLFFGMPAQADPVVVLVEAQAKSGNLDAVIAAFKKSQKNCAEWEGCLKFDVTVSSATANLVMLIEVWESKARHQQQVQTIMAGESFPGFRNLLAKDLAFHYLIPQ